MQRINGLNFYFFLKTTLLPKAKIFGNKEINILSKKSNKLKKSGLAGIFSASLELTREGIINIMQKKSFDKLLIKEKNE